MRSSLVYLFLLCSISTFARPPVVVISVDGLRADAIDKAHATFLQSLKQQGIYFDQASTVSPSITVPAHVSMLTGLDPTQHKITWDQHKPKKGALQYPTALEIAKKAGFKTALIVSKDKLRILNRPDSVDFFIKTKNKGSAVAQAFASHVKDSGMPDLSFIHIPDPDRTGHILTWMSPFYMMAVRSADKAVASIVKTANDASKEKPIVIITADHGGTLFWHRTNRKQNTNVPMIIVGNQVPKGMLNHSPVKVYDVAPTMLSLMGLKPPTTWRGTTLNLTAKTR